MNPIEQARQKLYADVVRMIQEHPEMTYQQIADKFEVYQLTVQNIASRHGITRKRGSVRKVEVR